MKLKFVYFIIFVLLFFCGICMNTFNSQASDSDFAALGNIYTFTDGKYNISESKEFALTSEGAHTYGKFTLDGSIIDVTEKDGISVYEVDEGNVSLYYTYGDSMLKADETSWHLSDDKSREIDTLKLDSKIGKGTIVLQVSIDGQNWSNEFIRTNAFEDKPIETDSFYTTNEIQLTNGCYYRVMVVYETKMKIGESKFLGIFSHEKYEYMNYAEVYKFYLINTEVKDEKNSDLKYNLGDKHRVSKNGYTEESSIEKDDVHYGWDLGNFFVSGYTAQKVDNEGNNVFLKNSGDKVILWFNLSQDINKLNNKVGLSIGNDNDGYDEYFETPRTEFGKGTLIIRYTDYENIKHDPIIYKNYLVANATLGADTKIQLFEEGDYEVALDYVIQNDSKILGFIPQSNDNHYRISFKFSVRNGNCMAFPMDLLTNEELSNVSFTENGFYLDLAKSRYLDVNIKREVLNEGENGLIEDVRFNKPAQDGDRYTDEGVYTITVRNMYTNQTTEKVIYVGTDEVLKAHVVTGLSVGDIRTQLQKGVQINADGTLTGVHSDYIPKKDYNFIKLGFIIFMSILVLVGILLILKKKRIHIRDFLNNRKTVDSEKGGN